MSEDKDRSIKNYIAKIEDENLRTKTEEFERLLNSEFAPKTKLEYCRIFGQILNASRRVPIEIKSFGKWIQARAVKKHMTQHGFLEKNAVIPGLHDKWTKHEPDKANDIETQIVSPEQFALILDYAPKPYGGIDRRWWFRFGCILAFRAGLRLGEVCTLEPKQIEIRGDGTIAITIPEEKAKGCQPHITFLPQEYRPYIDRFVTLNTPFELDEGYIMLAFKRVVKKIGLNDNITFHSLRHSFATWLTEKGVHTSKLQKFLGHKNPATTAIYQHVSTTVDDVMKRQLGF